MVTVAAALGLAVTPALAAERERPEKITIDHIVWSPVSTEVELHHPDFLWLPTISAGRT